MGVIRGIALVVCMCSYVMTQTIHQVIETRADLSKLRRIMTGSDSLTMLKEMPKDLNPLTGSFIPAKYTFFAANNAAFEEPQMKLGDYNRLLGTSMKQSDKEALFNYHTVKQTEAISKENLEKQRFTAFETQHNSERLYVEYYEQNQIRDIYINGGRVLEAVGCTNGIVYILDTFHSSLPKPEKIKTYLGTNPAKNIFGKFLNLAGNLVDGYISNTNAMVTLFAPSNTALSKIPTAELQKLERNKDLLVKVLQAHIIPYGAVFPPLLKLGAEYEVMISSKPIKIYGTQSGQNGLFVVSNSTSAQITSPAITCSNGVIYEIDRMFYVFHNALSKISSDPELRNFKSELLSLFTVDKTLEELLSSNSKTVTVFSPINQAFTDIADQGLSQDSEKMKRILDMHVIESTDATPLTQKDMTSGKVVKTRANTDMTIYKLTIYSSDGQPQEETYVDTGHIRARIIRSDIGVLNGVIHHIDHVLGVPYRTVGEELEKNYWLTKTQERIVKTRFYDNFNNFNYNLVTDMKRNFTMFAPNDTGWSNLESYLRNQSYGGVLLGTTDTSQTVSDSTRDYNKVWTNVLMRHIHVGSAVFLDKTRPGSYSLLTARGDKIQVFKENSEWYVTFPKVTGGNIKAHILQKDMGMKNGVVHLISTVLEDIDPNPRIGDWSNAATKISFSTFISFIISCLFVTVL